VRLDSFELRPLMVDQGSTCDGPAVEAEDGDLSGSFEVAGAAIRSSATSFDATGSIAEYCVFIPESGLYTLDARTRAANAASNSMQIQVDATTSFTWDAPVTSSWTTHRVIRPPAGRNAAITPAEELTIALNRGNHIVRFIAREPGVNISSFKFVPTTRPSYNGAPGFDAEPDFEGFLPPLRSVRIEPGDPITDLIVSSGERTEFVFAAGTHVIDNNTGIQPLDHQSFIGEVADDGTLLSVLDGENRITRAFLNPAKSQYVTIKSLEVKNFNSGKYDGAVDFDNMKTNMIDDPNNVDDPDNYSIRQWEEPAFWTLEDLWVHHNAGDGVEVGSGGRLVNVRSTDNGWLGIGGHGRNIEIIGGELARNASSAVEEYDCNWHSGGTKLTRVWDLTIRGVHSHNNCGPGIWMDISVNNALIEDNYVNGNNKAAIYYEISFNATIRNNTVIGSILIRESWDVRVEDNYVRGALRIQDEHGRRAPEIWRQPPRLRDGRPYGHYYTTFANNTVCSTGVNTRTGITTFGGTHTPSFDTTLWMNNDHFSSRFNRSGVGPMDIAAWKALGYDVEGTYGVYADCPATPPQP